MIIIFADAQETTAITECNESKKQECSIQYRTCYNYTDLGNNSDINGDNYYYYECGYCLNNYLEFQASCYNISNITTEEFTLLAKLLEQYLPEYVDTTVTTQVRVQRLVALAKIISFWNSQVPPPKFKLGLNKETFLTAEERKGRLGILGNLTYASNSNGGGEGKRTLERFVVQGINDEETLEEKESKVDGNANTAMRRREWRRTLQDIPLSIDWHARGYTTRIKNQGACGCCWAVSTVAAIESAMLITNMTTRNESGSANSLSFQQMISCDEENKGCDGGNIVSALYFGVKCRK